MENVLIPIFGIIFTFGAPVLIVWLAFKHYGYKKALMHETINKLVDAGQPVPPELISAFEKKPGSHMLQNGVILLGVAIGLFIFLYTLTGLDIASVAAIPLFIGLAFLILAKFDKRDIAA